MAGKNGGDASKSYPNPFFGFGQGQTEATTALQKELLSAYEKASRDWVARVQSEVAMWSELATKLGSGPLRSGSSRGVLEMCIAADADGGGRWTTTIR